MMAGLCTTALLSKASPAMAKETVTRTKGYLSVGMPQEGPDTPKLAAAWRQRYH
jgi:hypothetical protein